MGVIQFRRSVGPYAGVWILRPGGEGWSKDELRQQLQYLRREYPGSDWRIVWRKR